MGWITLYSRTSMPPKNGLAIFSTNMSLVEDLRCLPWLDWLCHPRCKPGCKGWNGEAAVAKARQRCDSESRKGNTYGSNRTWRNKVFHKTLFMSTQEE